MSKRQLAKILADSVSPDGVRLTTMEIILPRIVLAEANTHRQWSRNSASSRAIPVQKFIYAVLNDPFIPESWGRNGSGMQAKEALNEEESALATLQWLGARDDMVKRANNLLTIGVHKEVTNRLLEPWMWHTVIVSATEWLNFFHLRCNPMAHPAIRNTAEAMQEVYRSNTPNPIRYGEWHLPLVDSRDDGLSLEDKIKVSVARCARVSYLTHDGVRDPSKDIELHDSLLSNGHLSPTEHVARPICRGSLDQAYDDANLVGSLIPGTVLHPEDLRPADCFIGNFRGWVQYRKTVAGESDILGYRQS